jgi:sugar lactone lactonase YvrE
MARRLWPSLVVILFLIAVWRPGGADRLAAQARATATNVATIAHEAVPNFFKNPPGIYTGENMGIATNSKGNIYIYHRANETRLFEYTPAGGFVREIGRGNYGFAFAHSVRVDADDNIWAVDEGTDTIVKFSPGGQILMTIGRREDPVDALSNMAGAGAYHGRNEKYRFGRPTDIAFDQQGSIFIADGYFDSRVVKYDRTGRFIKAVGTRGNGNLQFNTPHSIATDFQGNVYVGDRGNARVQVLDNDLNWKANYTNVGNPWAVCVSGGPGPANPGKQYLYVSNSWPDSAPAGSVDFTGEVYKMELDGTIVGKFGRAGKAAGEFATIHQMDCRDPNVIYTAEINDWRSQKIVLKGQPMSAPASHEGRGFGGGVGRAMEGDAPFDAVEFLKMPADTFLGPIGGVGANSKGQIFVYTRTGHPYATLGDNRTFAHGGSRLFQFDPAGKFVRELGQDVYGFNAAIGLRIDPQDNIWTIDQAASQIVKFDPDGRILLVLGRKPEAINVRPAQPVGGGGASPASAASAASAGQGGAAGGRARGAGTPGSSFSEPSDVAWDRAGNIYVADGLGTNNRIAKFDKDGRFLAHWGSTGTAAGQFNGVKAIAIDAQDNVYVADMGNKRIQVFDAQGTFKSEFSSAGTPRAMCMTRGSTPYLYVADARDEDGMEDAKIYKMQLDGKVVTQFGRAGKDLREFGMANSIDCRNENGLLVGEMTNWRVQKITFQR